MCAVLNLAELPEKLQKELYEELKKKFAGGTRAGSRMPQEQKVLRVSLILRTLEGCTIPQQRSILSYTLSVLSNASHLFWRDPHEAGVKKGKGNAKV